MFFGEGQACLFTVFCSEKEISGWVQFCFIYLCVCLCRNVFPASAKGLSKDNETRSSLLSAHIKFLLLLELCLLFSDCHCGPAFQTLLQQSLCSPSTSRAPTAICRLCSCWACPGGLAMNPETALILGLLLSSCSEALPQSFLCAPLAP